MDKPKPAEKRKPAAKKSAAAGPRGKFYSRRVLLTPFLAVLFIAGFFVYMIQASQPVMKQAANKTAPSEHQFDPRGYNFNAAYPELPLPPDAPVLHVLFLGDIYTLVNNMPSMLAAVAASDTASPVNIRAETYGLADATLENLWPSQAAHAKLHVHSWDYVVLQDGGLLATNPMQSPVMYDAMIKWNTEIRHTGARTIIFQTWARKPYSDWYLSDKYRKFNLVSAEIMQNKVDDLISEIAGKTGAAVVPVGDIWEVCRDRQGMPDLYLPDGSNPSVAGDYLVTLLFYQMLTRHKTDSVSYVPPGITAEQAQTLKKCASYGG